MSIVFHALNCRFFLLRWTVQAYIIMTLRSADWPHNNRSKAFVYFGLYVSNCYIGTLFDIGLYIALVTRQDFIITISHLLASKVLGQKLNLVSDCDLKNYQCPNLPPFMLIYRRGGGGVILSIIVWGVHHFIVYCPNLLVYIT